MIGPSMRVGFTDWLIDCSVYRLIDSLIDSLKDCHGICLNYIFLWYPFLLLVGRINEERLKELLMTMGDRFSEEQVDEMFREAPIKEGLFDYLEFTRIIKHGAKQTVEDPNRV